MATVASILIRIGANSTGLRQELQKTKWSTSGQSLKGNATPGP